MRVPGIEPGRHFGARDFLTTIVFTTFIVCGLDYTLTIAIALGSRRLVSTRSKVFLLRLRSVLAFYSLHRIWRVLLQSFPIGHSNFTSKSLVSTYFTTLAFNLFTLWCGWWDSNSHTFRRQLLRLVRLPITSHPHYFFKYFIPTYVPNPAPNKLAIKL